MQCETCGKPMHKWKGRNRFICGYCVMKAKNAKGGEKAGFYFYKSKVTLPKLKFLETPFGEDDK